MIVLVSRHHVGRYMEDGTLELEIPCDNEGYVLLQCPKCGELFKARPSDIEDDSVLHIYCPSCGLTSDSFLTDDAVELATAMTSNWALEQLDKEFEKMARKAKAHKSPISLELKTKWEEVPETPLMPSVEALVSETCPDCERTAKISPLLAMSSHTCPFCGRGQFNDR